MVQNLSTEPWNAKRWKLFLVSETKEPPLLLVYSTPKDPSARNLFYQVEVQHQVMIAAALFRCGFPSTMPRVGKVLGRWLVLCMEMLWLWNLTLCIFFGSWKHERKVYMFRKQRFFSFPVRLCQKEGLTVALTSPGWHGHGMGQRPELGGWLQHG